VFFFWFPHISSHYQTSRHTQSGRELLSLHSWAASQPAFSYTLIQHCTSIPLPEPERHGFTPKMAVTSMSHWEVIKLPFCPLGQASIWTWVLTSLRSSAHLPLMVPAPHWVPLYIWGPHPDLTGGWIPLQIKLSVGTWCNLLLVVWGDVPQWQGRW
jgi:hypothetical protein